MSLFRTGDEKPQANQLCGKLLLKQTHGRLTAPGITVQRVNVPGVPVLTQGRSLPALAVQ